MWSTKIQTLAGLGLVIAAAGFSSQCARDPDKGLDSERTSGALLQEGFGPVATRTIEEWPDGRRLIEVRVTSTAQKSWLEADVLLGYSADCRDGRSVIPEWVAPPLAPPDAPSPLSGLHPEGTTFVKRLLCEGALFGEQRIDGVATPQDAMGAIGQRLAEDPRLSYSVTVYGITEKRPKYAAYEQFLGRVAKEALRECQGAVSLDQVIAVPLPRQDSDPEEVEGHLGIGVGYVCAVKHQNPPELTSATHQTGAAASPPPTSP